MIYLTSNSLSCFNVGDDDVLDYGVALGRVARRHGGCDEQKDEGRSHH